MRHTGRIGLGRGKGSGYRNLRGNDPRIHGDSAKGIKQPQRLSNLSFPQLKKKGVFLKYWGDADKDGVPNVKDCRPLNPKKQDDPKIEELHEKLKKATEKQEEKGSVSSIESQTGVPVRRIQRFLRPRNPSYTNSGVGDAFFRGRPSGHSLHMKIVERGNETLLVGYNWAVYAARDKVTGRTTAYDGWRGYSMTTSKQLSQAGLGNAEVHVAERREL